MKSSRKRISLVASVLSFSVLCTTVCMRADLAPWMQSAVSGSAIEAALYRAMEVPGVRALFHRPPAEARRELDKLVGATPASAELYALRAHTEEQSLDFASAGRDWKSFVNHSQDKATAGFELADYYHRRNQGPQEIAALEAAAALPSPAAEKFDSADNQAAWRAYPRALAVARDQALGDDALIAIYKAWLARYPSEPSARGQYIAELLKMRRFDETARAIEDYKAAFPRGQIFFIKATALLALDRNTATATAQALAFFDKSYQPLWPDDLISTYFELLDATHTRHAMLLTTRAQLVSNPDDLAAATKLFRYYQQQGRSEAAIQVLTEYGSSKDVRHTAWTADELYTFAQLLERTSQYPEAARYYYALAANPGRVTASSQPAAEAGLTGLTHILLAAPDRSIALGAGNLSIYRDIAALDHGPGYLNGILSLWLNSADPATGFHDEEVKATPYFHRQKAAELLATIDQRFPAAADRAALHAQLIHAYVEYGQDEAVKRAGRKFLADFPQSPQLLEVALAVADADARTKDTQAEFALYDSLLSKLSGPLQGMSLSAASIGAPAAAVSPAPPDPTADDEGSTPAQSPSPPSAAELLQKALDLPIAAPPLAATAQAYSQVLERYIARLLATDQPLAALAVLRRELDRNPNDPLFYERLADFLQQNNLTAQEEEVYRRALTRFNDTTFYDKLARFYIRLQRRQDFSNLTHKVVDTFRGTDLQAYFANVRTSWPDEYLQLNLYAHQRFPHDLVFTGNLLSAYQARSTADPVAYEHLLREHWQESPALQARFFDLLNRHGQLNTELSALQKLIPGPTERQQNPAATRELADIDLWQSHFEQSAPLLGSLANAYPADPTIGQSAASVFRSLAYFDPSQIARAIQVQQHLFDADPTDTDLLASIGDTYADSAATSLNLDTARQLSSAAPFFKRIATVHPGTPDGYLASATAFWDYFQFDEALSQIAAARKRFNSPALFGYQAGAIYEGKRDYSRAISEYVAAALAPQASRGESTPNTDSADAQARLISLAGRPQYASMVDHATADAVTQHSSLPALELRAAVLNTLHRPDELAGIVDSAINRAPALQELEDFASFAQQHRLAAAYRAALEREVTLTTDPVQYIELKYDLARAWQDAGDTASAQRVIEAVYNDGANARLVGVVRATADFYWNSKQPQRAIATLVSASQKANPGLNHDFLLEAIDKSNRSGDYANARTLLKPLLTADPFNPQYLSLQAESYSLAHDNAGLRDFYLATLAALRAAPLTPRDKRDKTVLVRQGLIPALTGLKDYSGAVDQHIALIGAFPEDATVLQSAASYARLYAREPQLVAFLQKTVAASPRDPRFAIDLGRVDLQFEDYAGALDAYSKAIAIRSDRPDLYIARADLEEHQQAFDAVCADYDRLYLLTYKDPQWMEKCALARARQGKPDLAVKALQTAWTAGPTATATDYFRIARQLEQWNMLAQADPFLAQGIKLAGEDLLTDPVNSDGAILYARIEARERKIPDALAFLAQAVQAASSSPSSPATIVRAVEDKGLAGITDAQWRTHLVEARRQQAHAAYARDLAEMFKVAGDFYTPEEKTSLAALLDAKHASASTEEALELWIPAASAAGLKDREAQWRREALLKGDSRSAGQPGAFISLESDRMDYATLGETLDTYAQQVRPAERPNILSSAATAWRNAGNLSRETADLRRLVLDEQRKEYQERLFDIYLHGNPQALLQLTSASNDTADAAANFLLQNGTQAQAYSAIANRAAARNAVWHSATSALTGLYFGDISPQTDSAFQSALANESIGQRLQARPDESKQIVGAPWFYYGTRYGYFLTLATSPAHDPEDDLPAVLELSSSDPASFSALATTYLDARKFDSAIAEYRHMLELTPDDPTPQVSIAEALWQAGRHDSAIAEWKTALTTLRGMVDVRVVPESFWTAFADTAGDAAKYHLGTQLKPGMNLVLEAYLRKNGNYRSTELLHSALNALVPGNETDAANWIVSLIETIPQDDQSAAFAPLLSQNWFPQTQRGGIYRRKIAITLAQLQASPSTTASDREMLDYQLSDLARIQAQYIRWLLTNNRFADAQRAFESIDPHQRNREELQVLALLLSARQSRLPSLLDSYRADPSSAPSLTTLTNAANELQTKGDRANQRLVLEYVFDRKLRQQQLSAPDYLSLAEARILTNDLRGAMDLLNRLTFQGDLYQNLDSAAALLVRTGHDEEALPLLKRLVVGVPWQQDYRVRLGRVQLALRQSAEADASLTAVANSSQTPYAVRASAAVELHAIAGNRQLGSADLNLAAGTATAQQANQPYFIYARIAAASALPAAQRPAILHDVILDAPPFLQDFLRLRIFEAEPEQNHYEQASVAIAPVLAKNPWLIFTSQNDTADNDDAPDDDSNGDNTTAAAVPAIPSPANVQTSTDNEAPYSLHTLLASPGRQRSFLVAVAMVDEHLDDTQAAINDLRAVERVTDDGTQRSAIVLRIAALQHTLDIARDNAGRRPVIQPSIEQTVRVRPRITLATAEVQP